MFTRLATILAHYLATFVLTSSLVAFDSAPANAVSNADIAIKMTTTSFTPGRRGLYTITVTNSGPEATNEPLVVELLLPTGISFSRSTGSGIVCSDGGSIVTCTRAAALNARRGTSFRVYVDVCAAPGSVVSTVRHAYPGDPKSSNDVFSRSTSVRSGTCGPTRTPTQTVPPTATPTGTIPGPPTTPVNTVAPTATATATATATPVPNATDLTISMTRLGTFYVGSTGGYYIVVSNNGPNAANVPVVVNHPLPTGLTYSSMSGSGWECTASGANVSCIRAVGLAAGSSTNYTLNVAIAAAAAPSKTAVSTVVYPADTDATNNTALRPTTIRN